MSETKKHTMSMIICPNCKRKMGRDHRCSRITRRHFFYGLLGGAVAVAATVTKPVGPQYKAMMMTISASFNPETRLWEADIAPLSAEEHLRLGDQVWVPLPAPAGVG